MLINILYIKRLILKSKKLLSLAHPPASLGEEIEIEIEIEIDR